MSHTAANSRATSRDSLKHIGSIAAANASVFVGPYTGALAIGAVITRFGVTEAEAGALLATELVALSVTALSVAPFLARLSRQWVASAGLLVLVAGNAGSIWSDTFAALVVSRLFAGAGAGLVLAAVTAIIASSVAPARIYGLATMAACLIASVLAPLMTMSIEEYGHAGYFGILFVLSAIVVPSLPWLPSRMQELPLRAAGVPRRFAEGSALIAGIIAVGIAMMAYYAFVERLGVRIGMDPDAVGLVLSGMLLASAVGGGLAAHVGQRFNVLTPLLIAVTLHALVVVMCVLTTRELVFAVSAIAQGLIYMFILPLQLTLAAELDSEGRWAALASGASFVGFGLGPVLGGWLITEVGYGALAYCMLGMTLPSLVAFYWAGRRTQATASES